MDILLRMVYLNWKKKFRRIIYSIKYNKNSTFNLVLSGKTTITKKQGEKEIYRFDGEIIEGKIKGNALIHRQYKDERNVEINLNYKNNKSFPNVQELEM